MTRVMSGHQDLNLKYVEAYEKFWETNELGSVTNVIPLITQPRSEKGLAWNVAVMRLFKKDSIPLTYASVQLDNLDPQVFISKLRDTYPHKSVRYLKLYPKHGLALVSLSSSSSPTEDGGDCPEPPLSGQIAS